MKKINTFCLTILAVICTAACSSEPSKSNAGNEKSSAVGQEVAKPQSNGVTIAGFLSGAAPDEAAATAFARGMDLAAGTDLKRTILDRTEGQPSNSSLQPLLKTVPLVIYWQTADLVQAAPVLKQSEVIAVSVWNVTEKVASLDNKVFGFGYSTRRSFAGFAKFTGAKLKSYRFAVLSSTSEPFSVQSKEFIEETKSLGNTIVFEEKVESAGADFKALLSRAIKENCDTIFAVLPADALVAFIKAARAASFKGKILLGDSFYQTELTALGKDAEGIYILQAWNDDATFKSNYAAKYGIEPDGITLGAAALGYDLIKCLEAAGANPTSSSISYSWLSTPCEGLTGKTQFSGERIAQRVKQILTVKEGKFQPAA